MNLGQLKFPVIIDGGHATVLEDLGCDLNNELWSAAIINTDPDKIIEVHKRYILAGAEIIATASYQASIPGLMAHGYTKQEALRTLLRTVELAQDAIKQLKVAELSSTTPLIGASMGPYGAYLADGSEYRGNYGVGKAELKAFHKERISIFENSDADLLLFETFPSLEELEVIAEITAAITKPSWVSFSCQDERHINDGTLVEKAASVFHNHPSVFAVGVNCTKPEYISGLIQRLKLNSDKRIVVYPNSSEDYNAETKEWSGEDENLGFTKKVEEWIQQGADLVGGCCRIGPDQINGLRQMLDAKA